MKFDFIGGIVVAVLGIAAMAVGFMVGASNACGQARYALEMSGHPELALMVKGLPTCQH